MKIEFNEEEREFLYGLCLLTINIPDIPGHPTTDEDKNKLRKLMLKLFKGET